jgi:putative transcriptional regulator
MTKMVEDLKRGLSEVDAFLGGAKAGFRVSLPADIDVKSIRKGLHMTQQKFSDAFGFSLDSVKHWEGGRRTPEAPARAFLMVIAKNPQAVIAALHPGSAVSTGLLRHRAAASSLHRKAKSKSSEILTAPI